MNRVVVKAKLKYLSPKSLIRLDNAACAYCGRDFCKQLPAEKEHVVGRRFVPKDSLAGQWNLIINSCRRCNERKAGLENDISSIVMRADPYMPNHSDPLLQNEAVRKGSAISPRTGKPISASGESFTVKHRLGPGINISFDFTAGPQVDPDRASLLAHHQVAAFFYLITYDKQMRRGKPVPGGFRTVFQTKRTDWGNPLLKGFQEMISPWDWRVHAIAANGYFKLQIRRHPIGDPCLWAWAVEWNQNYRVVGFFGERGASREALDALPRLNNKQLVDEWVDPEGVSNESWIRTESYLPDDEDTLFLPPDD